MRTTINFATNDPGRPPQEFAFVLTGQGRHGVWLVRTDDTAHGNVLVQTDADPADNRFVVSGRREAFSSQKVKAASNTGHTLRVSAGGNQVAVTYDGKQVLDAKDGTFKDAGKVGLWPKADSIICFDNFSVAGK